MSSKRYSADSPEHHEVASLIPWYANDTLGDHDRQRVDLHVATCAVCRDDLAVQNHIFEGMEAQPALDYMPAASLKRLQARLDAAQAQSDSPQAAWLDRMRRATPWRGWMAASIGALALAIGVLAGRWVQFEARERQPNYRTVTNPTARPKGEVIRAVFSPTITLVELQQLLDEAQLKIVSGPTEAGVYSLASDSSLTVRSSLELLRRHPAVRFAEETRPDTDSGSSP